MAPFVLPSLLARGLAFEGTRAPAVAQGLLTARRRLPAQV